MESRIKSRMKSRMGSGMKKIFFIIEEEKDFLFEREKNFLFTWGRKIFLFLGIFQENFFSPYFTI